MYSLGGFAFALFATVTDVPGNYPSKGGKGERAAWFHDSEGNRFGICEPIL